MRPSASMLNALAVLAARSAEAGAACVVGGSSGLLLRGIALGAPPRDLDIYADMSDAMALHARLADYATDVPRHSVTPIYESRLSHYLIDSTAVELVGSFVVQAHGCRYETRVRDLLLPLAEQAVVDAGTTVAVVPLAHELLFNMLRGRDDRVETVAAAMAADPARHYAALDRLLAVSRMTEEAERRLQEALRAAERGHSHG